MQPELPWNVAGIPPEAREAARAAARREGMSVGEWMTRRILSSFADVTVEQSPPQRESWGGAYRNDATQAQQPMGRDTEEMLARVSRSEADAMNAARRIEDQLRAVARRLDAAERSQSENNRATSKAAAEINVTAREQAQAFDQIGTSITSLAARVDRLERNIGGGHMKEAVKGLHQGLSRLADQISETANQSAFQITSLADNLESVAGKVGQAHQDAESIVRPLEGRVSQLDDRVDTIEKASDEIHAGLGRVVASLSALSRLEESVSRLETNRGDTAALTRLEQSVANLQTRTLDDSTDKRLNGIERTLADLVARMEGPGPAAALGDNVKILAQRMDASDKRQQDALAEMRAAFAQTTNRLGAIEGAAKAAAPPADFMVHPESQPEAPPPFVETSEIPPNVPPFQNVADPFAAPDPFVVTPPPPFEQASAFLSEPPPPEAPVPPPAPEAPPAMAPVAGDFLAAARRSAQAAAIQAEQERGLRGFGGFAWSQGLAQRAESKDTRYGMIALLTFAIILALVAALLLSQRPASPALHGSGLSALFAPKTPSVLKPEAPASDSLSPPTARQTATAVVPAQAKPQRTATSSPTLTPSKAQTVHPATVKPVTEPIKTAMVTPKPAVTSPASAPVASLDRLTVLANAGNAKAETIVAIRYLDGDGVPVNEIEGAKWLERAATHGNPVAEYRLGTLYERGKGVTADAAKALHWYQTAAAAGNRKAMHNLAVAYAQGNGTPKDFSEAARWFLKAANLGLADSQFNLAVLYERGLGVPQSLLDAYKWYAIAAAQGDAESKSRIDAIATQLSADDRAAAQRAADTFKPQPLDAAANVAPALNDVASR